MRERFVCAHEECAPKGVEAEFYPTLLLVTPDGRRLTTITSLPVCRLHAIRMKEPTQVLADGGESIAAPLRARVVGVGKMSIHSKDARKLREMQAARSS